MNESTICIIIVVFCLIALGVLIPVLIVKTKNAKHDRRKMVSIGPSISLLSQKATILLHEKGFSESAHDYSTAGYEYYEYKTVYKYEDNLHMVVDPISRQIAYYQYVPFHVNPASTYNNFEFFEVHNFSDIIKIDLVDSRGTIVSNSVGVGTAVGTSGVAVGVGTSTSVSYQMVNALGVTIFFKDGKEAGVNFLNNRSCLLGGEVYNQTLIEAKKLYALLESYISEESKPKETDVGDNITQIKKLKELLDEGIITKEEFEAKKKEFLGL